MNMLLYFGGALLQVEHVIIVVISSISISNAKLGKLI